MRKPLFIAAFTFVLISCNTHIPDKFAQMDVLPSIYPDYTDVTVPSNIAPLNFRIDCPGNEFVTRFSASGNEIVLKGRKTDMPLKKWSTLTDDGTDIKVEVFVLDEGNWKAYKPFQIHLAEPIDQYISYRLIPPSAVAYEQLTINQRDLTNFNEDVIYSNALVQKGSQGQCINCHHYRNYRTDNMQFHARQYKGGTILVTDGQLRKINLKTDSTLSAGVYPAWHPTHDFIAYSTNITKQSFQLSDANRTEVYDFESDLILFDINDNSVSIIENDSDEFECFPAWAPDGRTLYYVSAHYEVPDGVNREDLIIADHKNIRYDLYSKPFDPDTRTWGPSQKILDASSVGMSVTLPRVSPDGRYLMFTMGEYGVFHIWHKDSDLYLMDLSNDMIRNLFEINSNNVESYHSWSSNGKWVIFSSRREDGGFTRFYLAHHDGAGNFAKPFALPQRDPDFSEQFLRSYNIPEFMIEPVRISAHTFSRFIRKNDAQPVSFTQKREDGTAIQ